MAEGHALLLKLSLLQAMGALDLCVTQELQVADWLLLDVTWNEIPIPPSQL